MTTYPTLGEIVNSADGFNTNLIEVDFLDQWSAESLILENYKSLHRLRIKRATLSSQTDGDGTINIISMCLLDPSGFDMEVTIYY
jgi:hypothetical protein